MAGDYMNADIYNAAKFQFMTVGGAFERRIYKNWFGGVSYTQWKDVFEAVNDDNMFYVDVVKQLVHFQKGDLTNRVNYKMADLNVGYHYSTKNGRHTLKGGVGASYCWGSNEYVKVYLFNPIYGKDAVVILESRKVSYWGIVPSLGYDFMFLSNRLAIGPDIRARFYSGRPEAEYNINFHLGVNF